MFQPMNHSTEPEIRLSFEYLVKSQDDKIEALTSERQLLLTIRSINPEKLDRLAQIDNLIKENLLRRTAYLKRVAKKIKVERYIYTKCDCGYDFSIHHGDGYYSVPYENRKNYCPSCGQHVVFTEQEEVNG